MPLLGSIATATTGVYGFVALYCALVYLQERGSREFAALAIVSIGAGICAAGGTMLIDATTLGEAMFPSYLRALGVAIGLSGAAMLAQELHNLRWAPESRWPVIFTFLWAGTSIVLLFGGWVFSGQAAPPAWGISGLRGPLPGLTLVGSGLAVTGWLIGAWISVRLFTLSELFELRLLRWTWVGCLIAAAHDVLCQVASLDSLPMLPVACFAAALACGYYTVARFHRTRDAHSRRTAELQDSYTELALAQEELVRAEQFAVIGELSAVIAHEVRNPLAVLRNAASQLRRPGATEDDQATLLGILDEEVGRLNRLVQDLLTYTRPLQPQMTSVRVKSWIEVALDDLDDLGLPGEIEVEVRVRSDLTVEGDPQLLRRALVQILKNAVDALPSGGRIRIGAEERSDRLVLEIDDDGQGMTDAVLRQAPEPFFTTRPTGIGLGLPIATRVVESHGGQVRIHTKHGEGTTVHLEIPYRGRRGPHDTTGSTR
ncbi:MAG: ATP-binding protein [Myxococcota bacterium]